MMMQNHFSTERLELELISEMDAAFVLELLNTEGWLRFIGDRKVHNMEDAHAYIRRIRNTENLFYWVVRTKAANEPIGIISFLKRSYLGHFDIGFAFLPQHHGHGYAYEAADVVLQYARRQPEHAVILATTIPENGSSIKLLERLGLHFHQPIEVEGQPLHVYAIGDGLPSMQ